MQKGQINVQTENIFPIIKKFLYSDHEIFLRELISNAVDASQKLKTLSSIGEFKGEIGDLTIEVSIDKKHKTLTVSDKGVGMTAEEIEKYINQIAFSGAEEFVKKYKGKTDAENAGLIGHFGLGFYSSFMVSKKVEIQTKSHKKGPGSKAVKWTCDGSPEYTIDESDKEHRGTDIILHLDKDSENYLDEFKVLDLLKKYCKFLPIPIRFGNEKTSQKVEGEKDDKGNDKYIDIEKPRIINNSTPAWKRTPSELSEEDYKSFYRELYPMNFEDPLFNIHLNVDYPFNLTGILYFPKVKKHFDVQRDKIQLYCNQVFVTDSVEGIVPEFLTLLHGVIDSPDIPLNVSRSYLQSDPNVKKISSHITKKVADKLEEIFKNNREEFEKKWDDVKVFIQYGIVSDEKFYERAEKFTLFKNIDGKCFTIEEYKNHIKALQTDKDDKLVVLYTSNTQEQYAYIQSAKERGYDILVMDGIIDNHFMNTVERKEDKMSFVRIDSDVVDKLIPKEEILPSKLNEEEQKTLKTVLEGVIAKEKFSIVLENMSETDMPFMITQPEFMRRMKEMSEMGGGMNYWGMMPETYNLVVNTNHLLVDRLLKENDEEKRNSLIQQLTDIALLSQNMLKGEGLSNFIKRSVNVL